MGSDGTSVIQHEGLGEARLTKYVGTVHDETVAHVEKAIKLHLAID